MEKVEKSNNSPVDHNKEGYIRNVTLLRKHRIAAYSTVNVLHLAMHDVSFLAPLAVESLRQIKYTTKCAFAKV